MFRSRHLVWVVSLLIFLATLYQYRAVYAPYRRLCRFGYESLELACSLASGKGFADPFTPLPTGLSAHIAPAFPFLAAQVTVALQWVAAVSRNCGRPMPSPAAATASRMASRWSAMTWWSKGCSASRGRYTGATHPMSLGSAPALLCPCPEMDTPAQARRPCRAHARPADGRPQAARFQGPVTRSSLAICSRSWMIRSSFAPIHESIVNISPLRRRSSRAWPSAA